MNGREEYAMICAIAALCCGIAALAGVRMGWALARSSEPRGNAGRGENGRPADVVVMARAGGVTVLVGGEFLVHMTPEAARITAESLEEGADRADRIFGDSSWAEDFGGDA